MRAAVLSAAHRTGHKLCQLDVESVRSPPLTPFASTGNLSFVQAQVRNVAAQLATFEPLAEPSMAAEDFSFLAGMIAVIW